MHQGRGRTVPTFRIARGEVVGFIDIDLEVHARYIPSFVLAVQHGADLVTAHRIYKTHPRLFHRFVLSRGYSWLVQAMLGIRLNDTEAGFKFFRRDRLLAVLDQIEDQGWFWDTEVIARFLMKRHRVEEIPCLFLKRYDKKSSVRVIKDTLDYLGKHEFPGHRPPGGWARPCYALSGSTTDRCSLLDSPSSGKERRQRIGLSGISGKSSLLYAHPGLYHLLMRGLYGRYFESRYQALADAVPERAEVVDVCAGDAYLYRKYLRARSVTYTGLDLSPHMVRQARRWGVQVKEFNLWTDELPSAEIVILQASLYQFTPYAAEIVRKLLAAARRKLILAEPVVNLSSSSNPFLAWISHRMTTPELAQGSYSGKRFNQETFARLLKTFETLERCWLIPGGREMIAVLGGMAETMG
jgi:SAM-dependent methyltransferase